MFERIKDDFVWSPSDIGPIIKRDGVMIKHCVPMNPKRDEFFSDLGKLPMKDIERKYLRKSVAGRIMAVCKPVFYRIGIFSLYLKVKR